MILGHVVEYDMTSGKILRTLDDAHPLGSAVTHVRFTDDHRYPKRNQYVRIDYITFRIPSTKIVT